METYAGGQGAAHDLDGDDGVHTHLTNTRNAAVQLIESTYPLEVVRYGLLPDTEGAGKHRGGCRMIRELLCLAERPVLSMGSDRRRFTPWGLEGSQHAAGGARLCHFARLQRAGSADQGGGGAKQGRPVRHRDPRRRRLGQPVPAPGSRRAARRGRRNSQRAAGGTIYCSNSGRRSRRRRMRLPDHGFVYPQPLDGSHAAPMG